VLPFKNLLSRGLYFASPKEPTKSTLIDARKSWKHKAGSATALMVSSTVTGVLLLLLLH
jgi:hypothetical protein